jgi:pimeloyl-ACP methyl ester carboxylesterase
VKLPKTGDRAPKTRHRAPKTRHRAPNTRHRVPKAHHGAFEVALALAGAAAAGGLAEVAHMRRIARDPEKEKLDETPRGRAQRVRSADGTGLHVEAFGPEDGETVVLAHGWTEALRYWTYVIRGLKEKGLRVVAYDLRGHGDSEPAENGDYDIPRFGEDLEAVLAATVPEGRRAVVAGHSLGAMSIASWAEKHDVERRVRAAALLNTGVGDLVAEHLLLPVPGIAQVLNTVVARHGFLGNKAPLPRFSTPLSYTALRYVAFGRDASPAQVAFFERMLVTCPPDVRADIGIAMSAMDLHDALPRLTVPTIVLAGADDKLTPPSHARRIAEMLPQLRRLIVLENAGHMIPLERPDVVIEVLAELAARTLDAIPA